MNLWIHVFSLSQALPSENTSKISLSSHLQGLLEMHHCFDLWREGNDTGRLRDGVTPDFKDLNLRPGGAEKVRKLNLKSYLSYWHEILSLANIPRQTKSSSEKWLLQTRVLRDTFPGTLQTEAHLSRSPVFFGKKWSVTSWDSSFWHVCIMQLRRPFLLIESGRFNPGTASNLRRLYLPETE